MYPGVAPALREFLGHGEGDLNFMYLDNRQGERKVTTGIGFSIDPLAACLERHTSNRLSWYCGERLATEQEVRQEWEQVKSMQNFGRGQSGAMFQGRTNLNLRLRQPNIEAYFAQQAADYRQQLVTGSPKLAQFDTYPADAQMGVLALAWAVGAGGKGLTGWLVRSGVLPADPLALLADQSRSWSFCRSRRNFSKIFLPSRLVCPARQEFKDGCDHGPLLAQPRWVLVQQA